MNCFFLVSCFMKCSEPLDLFWGWGGWFFKKLKISYSSKFGLILEFLFSVLARKDWLLGSNSKITFMNGKFTYSTLKISYPWACLFRSVVSITTHFKPDTLLASIERCEDMPTMYLGISRTVPIYSTLSEYNYWFFWFRTYTYYRFLP